MAGQPRFVTSLVALARGEVPAGTLEAYRRAGSSVYDLLEAVEGRRLDHQLAGLDPWRVAPADQALLLCAWNAFVLQTLGDQLLDADYQADPLTVGFVPPVTRAQALAFYGPVEGWLSRARQAEHNPGYRLDTPVPAVLPPWAEVEPCPLPHLRALLAAARAARLHAENALGVFESGAAAAGQPAVRELRQQLAGANSAAEYAERLLGPDLNRELHEGVEGHLKAAVAGYYRLGQLLAMPVLLDGPRRPTGRASRPTPRHDFDPWCLTDPSTRDQWKRDRRARAAVEALWASDPDPAATLGLRGELDDALAAGTIELATTRTGSPLGPYFCCPWPSIFVVRRSVVVGGRSLAPGQQFTLDVSAEGMAAGGPFRREVLVGDFQPTDQVDYCDPDGEADHGDR